MTPDPQMRPASAPSSPLLASPPKAREGTNGRPIQVEVNYFPMKTTKLVNEAFLYHLTFKPPGPKKFVLRAMEGFRKKFFNDASLGLAFDGKDKAYTTCELNLDAVQEPQVIEVQGDQGIIKYAITIQFATLVNLQCLKE